MSINITKSELFNMILELRERLDLLAGKPRGPITMTEARLANERGDKVTVELFNKQWVAENMKGGTTAGIGQRGASAVNQNQQEGAG